MKAQSNGTNGTHADGLPVLAYAVNAIDVALLPDGGMLVAGLRLDQPTAFALSTALRLPGMRATINKAERLRQQAQALEGSER